MEAPAVRGLNHVTLAVTDVQRSVCFYRDRLGFRLRALWTEGAYLEAGPLWLCLSQDDHAAGRPHPDYSHLALDVDADTFSALAGSLAGCADLWRDNRSEGDSLYFLDPDGHRLELHVGSLQSRLDHYARTKPDSMQLWDADGARLM